jgi:peptidoglycan/LPS O-acetylase OafA/YrhL
VRTDARFDSIDALRGLAITLVIVYHAGPLAWRLAPYSSDGWLIWPSLGWKWLLVPFWHFGFAGVHLFFVLSGFCIHLRMARSKTAIDLKSYALRRFWRIYPPYWIALGIFGIVVPLVMRAAPSLRDLLLHATMLHTLDVRSFFSINPAFWSLATEEQFYLGYPLLLILLSRLGMRRVLLGALAISLAWRGAALLLLPPTVENFLQWRVLVHGLFLPRWFEWLLGCWLAELAVNGSLRGKSRALLGAAVMLLGLAMLTRVNIRIDKLLSDALFGCGFFALTGAVLGAEKARTSALFRAIGRRAYGLYLVHQPILDAPIGVALKLPLAIFAGWLFSMVCERPFEKKSQQVTKKPAMMVA